MDTETTAANPADEHTTAPVADEAPTQEANTPAEGTGEDTEQPDYSDLEALANGSVESANPDELVEVEIDGKTVKVSAEAKDYLLRQQDYTRKTMDLAEQRKAVEAAKAQYEQLSTASQEVIEAKFAAKAAEARVAQLRETVIDGLTQDQINALRLDLADAERAVAHHSAQAQEAARKAEEAGSQHFAKAVQEARAEAAKRIPNFSDARLAEFGSLVEKLGGDKDAVNHIADPAALQILHLADIGQKFIERQRQAGRASAANSVQPAAEVTSGKSAPVRKDIVRDADKMSTDEWLKARNEQLKRKQ